MKNDFLTFFLNFLPLSVWDHAKMANPMKIPHLLNNFCKLYLFSPPSTSSDPVITLKIAWQVSFFWNQWYEPLVYLFHYQRKKLLPLSQKYCTVSRKMKNDQFWNTISQKQMEGLASNFAVYQFSIKTTVMRNLSHVQSFNFEIWSVKVGYF